MREDGLDLWVRFWSEKRRERLNLRDGDPRAAGEPQVDRPRIIYDAAIILVGLAGFLALVHAVIAGISG
jgi:hypothetical protein